MGKKRSSTGKSPPRKAQSATDSLVRDMGQKIRRAREGADMTQADLATRIQRRQASLSDIENGKMEASPGTLVRIASALNKPIAHFFPDWAVSKIKPEDLSPMQQELLTNASMLTKDEMENIIIQVRALAHRNDLRYQEWLEREDPNSSQ